MPMPFLERTSSTWKPACPCGPVFSGYHAGLNAVCVTFKLKGDIVTNTSYLRLTPHSSHLLVWSDGLVLLNDFPTPSDLISLSIIDSITLSHISASWAPQVISRCTLHAENQRDDRKRKSRANRIFSTRL